MSTGNEAIDRLQALQLELQDQLDRDARRAFVGARIREVPLNLLIDRFVSIKTEGDIYGRSANQPEGFGMVYTDIGFNAPASGVMYLRRSSPEFEGLVVGFKFPAITQGVSPEKIQNCYDVAIMAPVLAITTCEIVS